MTNERTDAVRARLMDETIETALSVAAGARVQEARGADRERLGCSCSRMGPFLAGGRGGVADIASGRVAEVQERSWPLGSTQQQKMARLRGYSTGPKTKDAPLVYRT
jgi:hypothetical protein